MKEIRIIFFGATSDSVIVLEKVRTLRVTDYELRVAALVTQPPRPVGRKHVMTPTPTEMWAKDHDIPVLSFPHDSTKSWLYERERTVIDTLSPFQADLLVSASYGQLIPSEVITGVRLGGLNVHPSLLPRWRGADPVPWAILAGDRQTGATIVTLSKTFDEGKIIAQKKIPIAERDETDPLRARLFTMGADLLCQVLPDFLSGTAKGSSQSSENASYARRITRKDGFIPWSIVQRALGGEDTEPSQRPELFALNASHISLVLPTAIRALTPWPGVWTTVSKQDKRLKILAAHAQPVTNRLIIDSVQLEGKNPAPWRQFQTAYLSKSQPS